MPDAVRQALVEAGGTPLNSQALLDRAYALGARSKAARQLNVIDLAVHKLIHVRGLPVEKVGPRTWRWAGDDPK